tara:strand:- start:13 stop:1863 length:1851 start_codon:yes stop_codon:yes gene_type:complete
MGIMDEFNAALKTAKRGSQTTLVSPSETSQPTAPDWEDVPALMRENAYGSGKQLVSDIWQMVSNPVDTVSAVADLGKGIASKVIPGLELDESAADAFGQFMVDRYGGDEGDAFAGLRRTLATDPLGALADISGLLTGGGTAAAKGAAMVGKGARVVADAASSPLVLPQLGRQFDFPGVSKVAGAVATGAEGLARGGQAVADAAKWVDPIGGTFKAGSKVLTGVNNPAAKRLLEKGISPTVGQIIGGPANTLEQALTSFPGLGGVLSSGRSRPVRQLNTAAYNEALEPIGKTADDLPVGSAGINDVRDMIGMEYDKLIPNLDLTIDAELVQRLERILGEALPDMSTASAEQLTKIFEKRIAPNFSALEEGKVLTGQSVKTTESVLGALAEKFMRSANANEVFIGDALRNAQDALREALGRSNPQYKAELARINKAYAVYKRLEKAGTASGATLEGGFNPGQLDAAVRAMDRSKDKSRYARGQALLQDLSTDAKQVLGPTLPDSGTANRALHNALFLGGTGGAYVMSPAAAGVAATIAGANTPYLQGGMARALLQRPDLSIKAGNAVSRFGPAAGHLGYQAQRPNITDRIEPSTERRKNEPGNATMQEFYRLLESAKR